MVWVKQCRHAVVLNAFALRMTLVAAAVAITGVAFAYDIHTKTLTPIREKKAPAGAPLRLVEGGKLRFAIVTDDVRRDKKAIDLLREVFAKTVGS